MKSLGRTVDLLGPYQAGGAFVLRSWAKANPETLERYLAGYVESLRWVLDKSNRDEAIALLMEKRNLSRSLATRSYDLMIEPGFGFNPDAKLNAEGFDNVLKLRQEVEGGPMPHAGEISRSVVLRSGDAAARALNISSAPTDRPAPPPHRAPTAPHAAAPLFDQCA